MKILIAPNSFKESLSSVQISKIIYDKLNATKYELIVLPLSDGGDGFLDVIEFLNKENSKSYFFKNEFSGIPSENKIIINETSKELFIESADVIGLRKLPQQYRRPKQLNSFALGNLIKKIFEAKRNSQLPEFSKIILGIGGTATIDFGLGAAEALGVSFFAKNGRRIKPIPEKFLQIDDFILPDLTDKLFNQLNLTCVADVETPLLGFNSAIDLYGQQKGASSDELQKIKKGIEHIAEIMIKKNLMNDIAELNGAGGGLASGLKIFFDAEIISSNKFITEILFSRFNLSEVDYLITGEGKFDIQSFEGKATGELIKMFSSKVKKIFLICGKIDNEVKALLPNNVCVFQVKDLFRSEQESLLNTELGLALIIDKILSEKLIE